MIDAVPEAARPPAASREDLDLIDLLASRVRAVVVHELVQRGTLTTGELHAAVGGNRAGLLRHLRVLEDNGLVVASDPATRRTGKTVTWTLNADAVANHHRQIGRYWGIR